MSRAASPTGKTSLAPAAPAPAGLAFRLVGAALVAVPFLPLRALFGPLEGASALVPPGEWALGLFIFAVSAWLLTLFGGDRIEAVGRWPGLLHRGRDGVWLAGALSLTALILVSVSWFAFRRSPLLIDSVIQLFQAKIFASGALAAPVPPARAFFATQHMLMDGAGWYAQYPPGQSAILAPGAAVGAAWVVPLALTLGTVALVHASVRRMYDQACARLSLVLLVACPFFWFMGASFMNHVPTLFLVSLFLYLYVRWEDEGSAGWATAAGMALGAAALVRPLTAVAVAVPFAAFAAASKRRWHLLAAGAGFAALASLYLLYNARVTGSPFLTGYEKLWGEAHGLGFHATPWGGEHTPADGLGNEAVNLAQLSLYLFEWPVPALLPIGAAVALGWTARRWDRRLLTAFLALPAAYFFYWHRGEFLGPRFFYAGLAFLLPLTARALLEGARRLRGRAAQAGDLFRPVDGGAWLAVFLVLCSGYAAIYGIPQRFRIYATGLSSMKEDLGAEARKSGIDRGLVFVKVSWGNRILARMRGLGVPATLVEQAYREVAHCRLHRLVERASAESWSAGRLAREVSRALEGAGDLEKTGRLNGDPTLRMRPGGVGLTADCREEIRYDRTGYTNFSPHLPENDPSLGGPLVVARDLRDANARLAESFPGRPVYRWDGSRFRPLGATAGVRLRPPPPDAGRPTPATGACTGGSPCPGSRVTAVHDHHASGRR